MSAFILTVYRYKLTDELMDRNNLSNKPSPVICGLSVIILRMNLLTEKAKKNLYLFHSIGTSIVEYVNMSFHQ
jgi:hypothetical protein